MKRNGKVLSKSPNVAAVKRMADDVRKAFDRTNGNNVGISTFNYGLTDGDQVVRALKAALEPDIQVGEPRGFMGYLHFTKASA